MRIRIPAGSWPAVGRREADAEGTGWDVPWGLLSFLSNHLALFPLRFPQLTVMRLTPLTTYVGRFSCGSAKW